MTRAQQRDALAESQHLIVLAEGRADDAEASLGKARASGQGVETSLAAAQRQVWEANERLAEQEKFAVQQEVRLKQREMSQEGAIRKLVTEADSMALRLRQAEEEGAAMARQIEDSRAHMSEELAVPSGQVVALEIELQEAVGSCRQRKSWQSSGRCRHLRR